ncbi:calmodulin-regulated spectrin-associated protein 2 isoform X2 [Electrophorus electricus]|uniref:calmodulin-regulated spectrin-associated protein 2 isoform X2 n=1 Tax=Electrophorus electricus TaxID=8005 RepID=UPI0015D03348|nr:calmodulin-regulated spectrin-associated protein 2 isoform X2 [Electrophorus electricus]
MSSARPRSWALMHPRVDPTMGDAKQCARTFVVPDIKPFDHYDFTRAKISSSLTWLVAKAFGPDSVPVELEDPFYKDQYEQEHLKPPVVSLLLSAELYCRAGSLILRSDAAKPLLGHNAIIQALAQKGLYITDQERLVTERDLCQTPILMSAHLAMMDTLMMAYTVEMMSVERVLTCVQKFSPLSPEEDFPYDAEEAVTTWTNKVIEFLREILAQEQTRNAVEGKCAIQKTWSRREDAKAQLALCLPLVDNLLKDNTDGCALAALLHFYCPSAVPLEDICVKETMSLADSLYNLQLIQDFCRENLNNCCHFTLEDMVYGCSSIRSNYLVFMAELFWWFEVVKPSFVQPRMLETKVSDPVQAAPMAPVSKPSLISSTNSPVDDLSVRTPTVASSGGIKSSTSLLYVDTCTRTWPQERRSASSGISFEIPLDDPVSGSVDHGLSRSASSDGLGFKVHHAARGIRKNLSFQPVNGRAHTPLREEEDDEGAQRRRFGDEPNDSRCTNGVLLKPTMEEALKIIHDSERTHGSLRPPGEDNAFFLHSPAPNPDPEDSLPKAHVDDGEPNSASTDMDTGIHVCTEDIQDGQDEDSSLKDYSDMDQDYEARSCPLPDAGGAFSPVPSLLGVRSLATSSTSSIGSASRVRMTSFAEQKFRKMGHGDGWSGGNTSESEACATPAADTPDERSPRGVMKPRDPSSLLVSEMVHLKMKLEEKRRAIEAQKKNVEAAFTHHRQRMGRTAFLNLVRRRGGASPLRGVSGAKQNSALPKTEGGGSRSERCKPDGAALKSGPEEGGASEGADLAEYTRSIERLNASLSFLQTEMQRLAQQQECIMRLREQQSWVISPPHVQAQPSPQRLLRELRSSSVVGRGSVGSLSPNLSSTGSPRATQRSPAPIKRKSASFHARTPRAARPSEPKVTPFSRMLNTPQSVDSLPRLRRFSPRQTQTMSFAYLGHDEGPANEDRASKERTRPAEAEDEQPDGDESAAGTKPRQEEKDGGQVVDARQGDDSRPVTTAARQPQRTESPTVLPTEVLADAPGRKDLIEVPLSVLKLPDRRGQESGKESESIEKPLELDQRMCCGFFYRDDQKGEEDIAQKRAALLEKRLRREKETQMKKRQQEQDMEQKKEVARLKAEEDRQKKEEEKARREFIKNEYLRKKQLKLMEDMDSVIRSRPPSAKQKKPRPKSMHRDNMESSKAPAQTNTGSRPRGFSVSSLSLASLNLVDNESVQSDKRNSRPESAEGQLSPCLSTNRNGENWEDESTASSAEYTGPKLYKEPSAKSNKYIIQNALAHCCLAGKVNEGQKNKILEEMEKTESNNFLILFRDSGCQFRALYTYFPETEEICKLTGIGPKTITLKMIEKLYKYSSDKKQFSHIPAKTMSASVDAITIYGHLWQTRKQNTPKKPPK